MTVPISRRSLLAAVPAATLAAPRLARAQAWPAGTIRIICGTAAGGLTVLFSRAYGAYIAKQTGQTVIVENRPGADAVIGAQAVQRSDPDGHTLLVCAIHHSVHPSLKASLPYTFLQDFVPVSGAGIFPIIVCAHPSLPFDDIKGLIAHAKANPGKLSYGSAGVGGGTHLAGELFKSMTGTDMLHVAHRGSAPAMSSLLGNHVQLMFSDGPTAVPQVQAKTVKALGISPARLSLLPTIPTMPEAGLTGYEAYSWSGVVAPKGTPPEVVARLNEAMTRALKEPETVEKFEKFGAQPAPQTAAQFGAFLKNETEKWAKVVAAANIPRQQ